MLFEFKKIKNKPSRDYDAIKYASRGMPSLKTGMMYKSDTYGFLFVKKGVIYGTNSQFVLHAKISDVPDGSYHVFFKSSTAYLVKTKEDVKAPPFDNFIPCLVRDNSVQWQFHGKSFGNFYVKLFKLFSKKNITNMSINPAFIPLATDHGKEVDIFINTYGEDTYIIHIIACNDVLHRSAIICPIVTKDID